jgi:hypothetical protein
MSERPAQFPHRQDSDGLYHSICSACFATVARSRPESELSELEQAHICDQSFLDGRGHFNRADTARRLSTE